MRLNGLNYAIPHDELEGLKEYLSCRGISPIDPKNPLADASWQRWCENARRISSDRAERVVDFVRDQASFSGALASKLIAKIVVENVGEFLNCCFTLDHAPVSGEKVTVPAPLRSIAYHTSRYSGTTLGRGELSAFLISGSAEFQPGGREDIIVWDEPWHVKELAKNGSYRMNKAKGYAFTGSRVHERMISDPELRACGLSETLNSLRARKRKEQVERVFGSVEALLSEARDEMIERAFKVAVGVCVFDPNEWTLTFWRRECIDLAGVRDGVYQAKISKTGARR